MRAHIQNQENVIFNRNKTDGEDQSGNMRNSIQVPLISESNSAANSSTDNAEEVTTRKNYNEEACDQLSEFLEDSECKSREKSDQNMVEVVITEAKSISGMIAAAQLKYDTSKFCGYQYNGNSEDVSKESMTKCINKIVKEVDLSPRQADLLKGSSKNQRGGKGTKEVVPRTRPLSQRLAASKKFHKR